MKLITVVYPIYGKFDKSRLETAVTSAINQDYTTLRVLVSEENILPTFESAAKRMGISSYLFTTIRHSLWNLYFNCYRNLYLSSP